MTDEEDRERQEKERELLNFLSEFHIAYDHADLTEHPEVMKEWLDKLFGLHAELRMIEDAAILKTMTHSFSVKIEKGTVGAVKKD